MIENCQSLAAASTGSSMWRVAGISKTAQHKAECRPPPTGANVAAAFGGNTSTAGHVMTTMPCHGCRCNGVDYLVTANEGDARADWPGE